MAELITPRTCPERLANVWKAADKVVYSTTLTAVSTANTRLEHHSIPARYTT